MLRGVNKNIIEIHQTDNKYIERAILFLKDNTKDKDGIFLENNADKYLKELDVEIKNNLNIKYKKIKIWVYLALSAAIGAAISSLVFFLI